MVRQVRLVERYDDATNPLIKRTRRVFAFGTHPLASETEVHPVTSAGASNNSLRIIMDELLVGNYLEEIACRGQVDEDAYSRVPVGTTPDDIARCSAADDVLPSLCRGPTAVCLCKTAGGCIRGTDMVPENAPVGVLDINQDGAVDDTRIIPGAVGIRCGTIDVPLNLDSTYWNPSGDQNKPAMGGFDALGPALVVVPETALPTNLTCGITFSPEVVDKQGNAVCAPPNGDVSVGCTPGDVGAVTFRVEPLIIDPGSFTDGATGIGLTQPLTLAANAPVDLVSAQSGVTITPTPAGQVTVSMPMPNIIRIDVEGGLLPATEYTITISTAVTDRFAQAFPAAQSYTFTTVN